MNDPPSEEKTSLWISEGELDLPIYFEIPADKKFEGFYVDLADETPDGFAQLRPVDRNRATSSVFTSASQPVRYQFRAGVLASDSGMAFMRGRELAEHLSDRLTMMTGYPVKVLKLGAVYNEDELRDCVAGIRVDYQMTTGGEDCFRTQQPRNWHSIPKLLALPQQAIEPARWFRHAMLASREVDQFLAYYIALESIAPHIPGISRATRKCEQCHIEMGTESAANAGIKFLISRHPTLDNKARQRLKKLRARIAHGNTDAGTLLTAKANLHIVHRLAADGIALAIGVDPSQLHFLAPRQFDLLPICVAPYQPDQNPATQWHGLLSERFREWREQHRGVA